MAKNKKFNSYPTRSITLSNKVWKEMKNEKEKFGKNWNAFFEELLKEYNVKNR